MTFNVAAFTDAAPARPLISDVFALRDAQEVCAITTLPSFDSLFPELHYLSPASRDGVLYYDIEPGWYPLSGLPGTVSPKSGEIVIVKPCKSLIDRLQLGMTTGVIGGFRSVRSAAWMKQDKLPVFVFDYTRTVSRLLALLPISEHERFERRERV